ncbi:MAG: ABC transporter permease [Chthoniobacterales bacterium]
MIHDLRFAFRQLVKTPGFTLTAVLVLALGIGANTAVFSLVHTLFFKPPAYARPNELVQVFSQNSKNPKSYRMFSYPTYGDIRDQNTVFTETLGYNLALVGLGKQGETRRAFAALCSSNYFSVMGVPLVRGRTFLPEEETPGRGASVAIVSYGYWQKHNRDQDMVGSQVVINGRPFTIVGIAPRGFTGTLQIFSPEVWLPLGVYDQVANDFQDIETRGTFGQRAGQQLIIVGRLKPGITAAKAEPSLKGLAANLEKAFPVEQKDQTFQIAPVSRSSVSDAPPDDGQLSSIVPLLLGMAVVVLLVACLNLANMLLARGTARRKEIAIRIALGGSRGRIVRQLLVEGFVLALIGGAAGLVIGLWSSDLLVGSLRRLMPLDIVWLSGPQPAILLATFGFCLLGTLAFALGPALKLSRATVVEELKHQAGEDVVSRRWRFLPRHPLVVMQIAFSLMLLTAAGLFVRGASKAASVDTGLKPGASFLVETDASLAGYDPTHSREVYRSLNERLAALPNVEHVSVSATVPFGMITLNKKIQRAGVRPGPDEKPATAAEGLAFSAEYDSVGADYFNTVGLPVIRGRAFNEVETTQPTGQVVAIIDDVLAKKLWPEGDALGQQVQFASDTAPAAKGGGGNSMGMNADLSGDIKPGETIQIIGIVPSTRHALFEKERPGAIYLPFARGFQSNVSFFVRFHSLPKSSISSTADLLRRTVRDIDQSLPIISLKTFEQHLDSNLQLWVVRAGAAMFSIFGGLALILAIIGLYGIKAYSVARRTREIGIRMALGAQRTAVLRMIMREGSIMLLCGVALGLVLAAATGKVVSGILYGVGALDPIAFASAPVILAIAALIATWIPARRATRVNPMVALRTE